MLKLNETPGQDSEFWSEVSRIFAEMDPNWYGLGLFNLLMQLLMLVFLLGVFSTKRGRIWIEEASGNQIIDLGLDYNGSRRWHHLIVSLSRCISII